MIGSGRSTLSSLTHLERQANVEGILGQLLDLLLGCASQNSTAHDRRLQKGSWYINFPHPN